MASLEQLEFVGYVRHIFDKGDYGHEFVVANYGSESEMEDMRYSKKEIPVALKFRANVKNGAAEQVKGISDGDKVKVRYFLCGREGTSRSTGKYYAITELNVAKKDGIEIIEKAKVEEPETVEPEVMPEDIPF